MTDIEKAVASTEFIRLYNSWFEVRKKLKNLSVYEWNLWLNIFHIVNEYTLKFKNKIPVSMEETQTAFKEILRNLKAFKPVDFSVLQNHHFKLMIAICENRFAGKE